MNDWKQKATANLYSSATNFIGYAKAVEKFYNSHLKN